MLRSIKIKNFKSISTEQSLSNLSHINILTGENNSGKTAILETLWLLSEIFELNKHSIGALINQEGINVSNYTNKIKELYPKYSTGDFFYNKSVNEQIEIELSFDSPNKKLSDFFNELVYSELRDGLLKTSGDLNIITIRTMLTKDIFGIRNVFWGNIRLTAENNTRKLLDVISYLRQQSHPMNFSHSLNIDVYQSIFIPAIQEALKNFTIFYIPSKRKIEPIIHINDGNKDYKGSFLKRELFRLYHGNINEQNNYDKILDLFFNITNKKIVHKPFYDRDTHTTEIVFQEGNTFIDIDSSGYGYYQLINILYNMVVHEANIILIDEPEISLHPQAQINFFDAINKISEKENKQFFIATHSPYFINLRYIPNVYKSTKSDRTYVRRITNVNLLERLLQKQDRVFAFRFRELLFLNNVIFVEGFDDLEFCIKFIEDENIPIKNPLERFYEIDGYQLEKIEMLSAFCNDLGIQYKFLFDFDYFLRSPQIDKLINALEIVKKDSELLKKIKEFPKTDNRKKSKAEISLVWQEEYQQYWKEKSFIELMDSESKNNFFFIPAFDINILGDSIRKGDKELKNLFSEFLKKHFA